MGTASETLNPKPYTASERAAMAELKLIQSGEGAALTRASCILGSIGLQGSGLDGPLGFRALEGV